VHGALYRTKMTHCAPWHQSRTSTASCRSPPRPLKSLSDVPCLAFAQPRPHWHSPPAHPGDLLRADRVAPPAGLPVQEYRRALLPSEVLRHALCIAQGEPGPQQRSLAAVLNVANVPAAPLSGGRGC
jgi:hypothetical protein